VKSIRLLPVVILAVSALLVLKIMGLAVTGSYVLGGVTTAQAEEGGGHGAPAAAAPSADGTMAMPVEPTMADNSPTLSDASPTLGQPAATGEHGAAPAAPAGDHGAPATETPAASGHDAAPAGEHGAAPAGEHGAEGGLPAGLDVVCPPTGAATPVLGEGATSPAALDPTAVAADDHSAPAGPTVSAGCVPLTDALPSHLGADGQPIPLVGEDGQTLSEAAVLESLGKRRAELQNYEQELVLRSSLVDAAEKKVAERQATLQALEDQISALVDQRTALEAGQFAGIVTLYQNMKPKDAANIFNSLDMEVLLRVAKLMNPRKMSPILAAMDATRAQELTVRMAALSDQPPEQMSPDALAALPQIVGQ
jgi:flagellar motility protein MotE (MotC chaperone)